MQRGNPTPAPDAVLDVSAAMAALAELLDGNRPLKASTADGLAVMIGLLASRLERHGAEALDNAR